MWCLGSRISFEITAKTWTMAEWNNNINNNNNNNNNNVTSIQFMFIKVPCQKADG